MGIYENYKITGVDYIEFSVADLEKYTALFAALGFEKTAQRELRERQLKTVWLRQNKINVLLSQSSLPSDPVASFHNAHGDGIYDVGLTCEDATSALELAVSRGGVAAEGPRSFERASGNLTRTSLKTFGDVRLSFISRSGDIFLEGFESLPKTPAKGFGMEAIDHLTVNVEQGKMDHWASQFEKLFGFQNTRFFDIHTERTGLYSKVMQSPDGLLKMPFNEPTESASQIQEFLDINHGAGIQHLALTTADAIATVRSLRNAGFKFLEVPLTYYETIPKRVPNVAEPISDLSALGILVDGDSAGYLLQIFTAPLVGPFFIEVIQRKGNQGFGEGNFRALFEAMELDQIRRGVLKA